MDSEPGSKSDDYEHKIKLAANYNSSSGIKTVAKTI